jgi:hypothetical protein
MKYVGMIVLSVILTMPGMAFGLGFNPFRSSGDSAPPPPNGNTSLVKTQGNNSVPLPGTALAFGVGFLAFAAWRRYRH